MAKKIIAVGSCEGVEEILSPRGYAIDYVAQKNVLDTLRKEGVEAVIIDMDDTVKPHVVIGGIRHLYPGLWITAISRNNDEQPHSLALKAGASCYIIKPVSAETLLIGEEVHPAGGGTAIGMKYPVIDTAVLDESKRLFPGRFHDAFFINEYGKLETLRAERYNKNFSVILTHIEGFHDIKKKMEKKELLDFLKELINTIMETLRNCDVVGMVEDRKIVAILPETDYFGSCVSVRKLKKAVEMMIAKGEHHATIIFSNVTYPRNGKGYGELLRAAEDKVVEQREGVWMKFGFENKPFWEVVSTLLQGREYETEDLMSFDIGTGLDFPVFFIDRLQEIILQEIARDPKKKGFLYLGIRKITPNHPIVKAVETIGTTATKIYVAGEGDEGRLSFANAIPLYLADPRLLETFFMLLLRDDFSYALICRERWGEQYSCVHTVDQYLVEGMISKFQKEYSLQEQL